MEQPRTLVIAMTDNMITSQWNRKTGFKVVMRPDLQRFLTQMSQYYEIVLWDMSPALSGLGYVEAIDPKMQFFSGMLWRDSTTWRWGHKKDLSKINRDMNRVVMLEVDPTVSLQKGNTIILKKFDNVDDVSDDSLMEIVPFLESLVVNNVEDVREIIKKYEGKAIGSTYNEEIKEKRERY